MQLDKSQRWFVLSILGEVLGALNASGEELPPTGSIQWAQNRLFDAIYEQCEPFTYVEGSVHRKAS